MSDDSGFVERPALLRRGREIGPNGIAARLLKTAENGKAITLRAGAAHSAITALRRRGFRVHQTLNGAAAGMVNAWAEKIDPEAKP